jgi:hypothetical protein
MLPQSQDMGDLGGDPRKQEGRRRKNEMGKEESAIMKLCGGSFSCGQREN